MPEKRAASMRDGPRVSQSNERTSRLSRWSLRLYGYPSTARSSARAMSFTNDCILICINAVARKHKCDVLATRQHVELKRRVTMSKMRICFLAAVAAAGIGLGGTFGA